jgi:hypothetical protein
MLTVLIDMLRLATTTSEQFKTRNEKQQMKPIVLCRAFDAEVKYGIPTH